MLSNLSRLTTSLLKELTKPEPVSAKIFFFFPVVFAVGLIISFSEKSLLLPFPFCCLSAKVHEELSEDGSGNPFISRVPLVWSRVADWGELAGEENI